MDYRLNTNLICSLLCVDMVGHSRRLETDQYRRKARLQDVMQSALQAIPESDRVILDTGDGAAIAFLGAPEDALSVALKIADGMAQDRANYPKDVIELRSGMHLGPVRMMHDINGVVHFVGDGLNVTQRIMALARPGNTVVSRQYYDVVTPENADALHVLHSVGERRDREGRAYELYILECSASLRLPTWKSVKRRVGAPSLRWAGAFLALGLFAAFLLSTGWDTRPSVSLAIPDAAVPDAGAANRASTIHEQGSASREGSAAAGKHPEKGADSCSAAARMLDKCSD